jgi:hypothetical protein
MDLQDSEKLFLLAYRAVLKESHASRKSVLDTQLPYQKAVELGVLPRDVPSAQGELALDHMIAA